VKASYEIEIDDPPLKTEPRIGLDRGVVNLIANSDGERVPAPRTHKNALPQLRRAQRQTAKKKKGSENQKKTRVRENRLHRKARRQRDAVLHRESLRYAKSHGTVVLERLNIQSMTKSAKGTVEEPGRNVAAKSGLNRGILDAGWGKFGETLAYKLEERGGQVISVDAAYTSQTCSACGAVAAASRKSQSEFVCVVCGHQDHADVNAAKVILSRGTHGGAVCGGPGARGRPTKQKLRVVRRGSLTSI
jgi:putative transposase